MASTEYERAKHNSSNAFYRTLNNLRRRRKRIELGLINSIPLPFNRFRKWYPGLEKSKYIILTASQKVGKSKLADKICVYDPFFYAVENPDKLRVKILCFTLEVAEEDKIVEFYCHLLWYLDKIRISPTQLKSTDSEDIVPEEILDLLETDRYQKYITKFKDTVTYIDDVKNPTGINKYCVAHALDNGTMHMKQEYRRSKFENTNSNEKPEMVLTDVPDYYEPNDPEEYRIIILDNYSNLYNEQGFNKMQTIEKMSKYCIDLRDRYKYTIVAVQHQSQAQEGIENIKMDRTRPTADGLADCKVTSRDVNLLLGLYSPYKYGKREYEGYNVERFKNHIRFLEILEDRDNGGSGMICPLYFDGAVSEFEELPLPDDNYELSKYYNLLNKIEQNAVFFKENKETLFFIWSRKNKNIKNIINNICKWIKIKKQKLRKY